MITKIDTMETAASAAHEAHEANQAHEVSQAHEASRCRSLKPAVLRAARERAGLDVATLAAEMGVEADAVEAWEQSGELPTSLLDQLAEATSTPWSYLFGDVLTPESLTIRDLRLPPDAPRQTPSPNLLDIIRAMTMRQWFMLPEMIYMEKEPLDFTSDAALKDASPQQAAVAMREVLGLHDGWSAEQSSWEASWQLLRDRIEAAGVLIFFNDNVCNDARYCLNPDEFKGFALLDDRLEKYAPLMFVNSADHRAAQLLTVAHELAHLFLGEEGLSTFHKMLPAANPVEQRCDAIAAEFLLPQGLLREFWHHAGSASATAAEIFAGVADRFKVGPLVAARRAYDIGLATEAELFEFYDQFSDQRSQRTRPEAVDPQEFWKKQRDFVGHRFGQAVVHAADSNRLLYNDAYELTGLHGSWFTALMETIAAEEWK